MNLNHKTNFLDGDAIHAEDWNKLASDVNELGGDTHVYVNDKGNLCIETTVENTPSGKKGKINIESKDDLQLKPGDDIIFYSNHRPVANMDEVSVKVTDGEDHPVKLQLNAADIVLTTKDKGSTMTKDANGNDTSTPMYNDPNVMNVTINSAKNTRGYLKVRAQAIDLRCEENGGIALLPKGEDSGHHENKIKFEHNGGDGLEFGTFNTEKTSVFTNEYRFNKDGIIYAVARETPTVLSYKEDGVTPKKTDYPTQDDDFKDIPITDEGSSCTWDSTNGWKAPSGEHILSCTWEDLVRLVYYMKTHQEGPWKLL